MPELPEVETVRKGLDELLANRKISSVSVFDSPKSFPNDPASVDQFMIGGKVLSVRRRAKVLIIDLDTKYSIVVHLKMTGQLVFRAPSKAFGGGHPSDSLIGDLPDRSTRVQADFDDGSRLFFNDQRKFGWMKLVPTIGVEEIPFISKLGPEPLELSTTAEQFVARIRRRNGSMIKPAILDQTVIAGVGNIYADEALWSAKIHPETRVRDVSDDDLVNLFVQTVAVLKLSIEKGGSTDRNYVDAEGRKGSYLSFARVFRREGQACHVHPDQEIIKLRVGGRGTHICPVCQVRV